MDSVTQALLGGAVAQCGFTHKLGRRATYWGMAAGIVPDLDVAVIPFTGRMGEFLWHRGPTHAFWFGPVFGALFGYGVWRWYQRRQTRQNAVELPPGAPNPAAPEALFWWIALWFAVLFTHPLLDIFTPYGTLFFWPFSDWRVALHGVPIIDPFYSLTLIAALGLGVYWRKKLLRGTVAAAIALLISTAYLFYGWHLNESAKSVVYASLSETQQAESRIAVYPTMFQVYYRRVVVQQDDEIRVGFMTMWKPDAPIRWETPFRSAQGPEVDALLATRQGAVFKWFAMDEIGARILQNHTVTLVEIDDLRYGLPGRPADGLWGIRGRFDDAGRLENTPEFYDRAGFEEGGAVLAELWRGIFALDAYTIQP